MHIQAFEHAMVIPTDMLTYLQKPEFILNTLLHFFKICEGGHKVTKRCTGVILSYSGIVKVSF